MKYKSKVSLKKTDKKSVNPILEDMSCSDGWFVTGYYTPDEGEFDNANMVEIEVKDKGRDKFPSGFLKHVKIEGWARTRHGWFLGWHNGWIAGDAALNARGQPLRIGSLAVDRSVIPLGTSVHIPNLLSPWNQQLFVADDTGGGILGKHVDVFCGTGKNAHKETLRITAHARRVCLG